VGDAGELSSLAESEELGEFVVDVEDRTPFLSAPHTQAGKDNRYRLADVSVMVGTTSGAGDGQRDSADQ
jgi:hypothetical protein